MSTSLAEHPVEDARAERTARRARTSLAVVAVALLAVVAGLLLGRGLGTGPADVDDDVSIGFLQDMKVHHAQAVAMSEAVHRRSTDPALQYLAFDIMTTQQGQIGIMTGWLDLWGERQSGSGPVMAWMGHEGPMPGMASEEQVAALGALPVAEMEAEYLRLMVEHHRGALDMAQAAADGAGSPDVANLARGMLTGQASEIELMEGLLAARGLEAPAAGAGHSGH